jgi:hypothetical protein
VGSRWPWNLERAVELGEEGRSLSPRTQQVFQGRLLLPSPAAGAPLPPLCPLRPWSKKHGDQPRSYSVPLGPTHLWWLLQDSAGMGLPALLSCSLPREVEDRTQSEDWESLRGLSASKAWTTSVLGKGDTSSTSHGILGKQSLWLLPGPRGSAYPS